MEMVIFYAFLIPLLLFLISLLWHTWYGYHAFNDCKLTPGSTVMLIMTVLLTFGSLTFVSAVVALELGLVSAGGG